MGNKRNWRSRRLETPSPDRNPIEAQVDTSTQGNETLTKFNSVLLENLGENVSENPMVEPSQISNEIQAWTQIIEQKNNDRIERMREEIDNKFEAILKEIKSNKSASTVTNPRSELNENQEPQASGSKTNKSIGVHASLNENSD